MSTPSSKKKKKNRKRGGVSKDNSLLNKMRNAKFAQSCLQHHNLYKENATIISAHMGGSMSVISLLVLSLVIGRMWNKSPPVPTLKNSYLKPGTLSWKKGLPCFQVKKNFFYYFWPNNLTLYVTALFKDNSTLSQNRALYLHLITSFNLRDQ